MKRFRSRVAAARRDLHSLGFQTSLELAAGGIATAALLRWLAM